MIRSDPAECAMESRIAHEWDILGTGCRSFCLFSVFMRVSISHFIYHYPTHTLRIFFGLICRNFRSSVLFQIGCLSITFLFQLSKCVVSRTLAPCCVLLFFNQSRADAFYQEQSNLSIPMRCNVCRQMVVSGPFLMTHDLFLHPQATA